MNSHKHSELLHEDISEFNGFQVCFEVFLSSHLILISSQVTEIKFGAIAPSGTRAIYQKYQRLTAG